MIDTAARGMALYNSDTLLIVACETAGGLSVFTRDPTTGKLVFQKFVMNTSPNTLLVGGACPFPCCGCSLLAMRLLVLASLWLCGT